MSQAIQNAVEKKVVAQTIMSQISRRELWAIGAKNFLSLSNTLYGGLQFSASLFGNKPCKVQIILNGRDLYDIVLMNSRGTVLKSFTDIYAEDMEAIVIEAVEKRFAQ